jgi:hypothetical protein
VHGTLSLLPPSPFVDLSRRLTDARAALVEARDKLNSRRSKATVTKFYAALDAVWTAQGGRNP